MREAESLAVYHFEKIALQLIARRERHRVNQDIEALPVRRQRVENCGDFRVVLDVARQRYG